jgi:hypothetical protein
VSKLFAMGCYPDRYWEQCPGHVWQPYESMSDYEVVCEICDVHGEMDATTGEVYFPVT